MMFAKPPDGGCASTTKNDPMTHWALARPARFINPPETLLWHCRLDGKLTYGWALSFPEKRLTVHTFLSEKLTPEFSPSIRAGLKSV